MSTFEVIRSAADGDACTLGLRLVTAPGTGRFHPADVSESETVEAGAVLGHVVRSGTAEPVVASCTGRLASVMAERGELVRFGQPLACLHPEHR